MTNPAIVRWDTPLTARVASHDVEPKVIFFAGRVDNRRDLIHAFGSSAHETDSTLVRLAYQKYGRVCPKFVIGDFAFAIWDAKLREVFAARDAAGCQPVYYHTNSEFFAISDSIESLLSAGGISRDLDEPFVAAALTRIYAHPERTFLAEVRKVPPAHWLAIRPDARVQEAYWRAEDVPRTRWKNFEECAEAFRETVRQAVRDRLPKDGQVGVHLSGGLDCSSVAVMAGEELRQAGRPAPVAFSWHPALNGQITNEDWLSEYKPIKAVAAREKMDPVYCPVSKQDVLDVLRRDDTVRRICGTTYSEWPVQREAAARGVKVMMSGFGGDEAASFNGRGFFCGLALRGRWGRLYREARAAGRNPGRFGAGWLRRGLIHLLLPERILGRYWRESQFGIPSWKIIARTVSPPHVISPFLLSESQWRGLKDTHGYLNEDFRRSVTPLEFWSTIRETSARGAQCQLLQQGHLAYRLESWAADGALHGLRYVYPLLDRRVVEFALSLPEDAFIDHNWNRLFFRRAMDPILPPEVCWHRAYRELARCDAATLEIRHAFVEFGKRLRAGDISSPRMAYLDMPRLMQDLDHEAVKDRERFAKLFFAVQFLGLEQE